MDDVVDSLKKLDNLEELYEVTGEFDIVSLLSATDIEEFREVLKNKIMKIPGVKSTVSSVVLMSHKGPRCTQEVPKDALNELPKEASKEAPKARLAPRQ